VLPRLRRVLRVAGGSFFSFNSPSAYLHRHTFRTGIQVVDLNGRNPLTKISLTHENHQIERGSNTKMRTLRRETEGLVSGKLFNGRVSAPIRGVRALAEAQWSAETWGEI